MSEQSERDRDLAMARLWLDRALRQDDKHMGGLTARARVSGKRVTGSRPSLT